MTNQLESKEKPPRGEIVERNGVYYAEIEGNMVEIEPGLAKVISKFLRAQARVDTDEDNTATRLTKQISDATNCHLTASRIAGIQGESKDLRRAQGIMDHIDQAGVEQDELGQIGEKCPDINSMISLIENTGTYPAVVLQSSYGVAIHSFIVLGKSDTGEIILFEKVNKGHTNPWQLRTLTDFFASVEQFKEVSDYAVASI